MKQFTEGEPGFAFGYTEASKFLWQRLLRYATKGKFYGGY